MSDTPEQDTIDALKIAFTYMPRAIEVTQYEYGDRYKQVLEHIEKVRECLLVHGLDPDEIADEVLGGGNSCY